MSNDKVNEDNFKNQLIDALAVRFKTSIPTIKRWLEGTCEPHPVIKQAVLKSLITDHELIVDELKAEVAQAKREAADAMSGCCDCPMFKAQGKTVARQAKVIEKLKDVVTCVGCAVNESCPYAWDGYNTNGDCLAEK